MLHMPSVGWINLSIVLILVIITFSLIYAFKARPFREAKANLALLIEEVGTFISIVLLFCIQADYERE